MTNARATPLPPVDRVTPIPTTTCLMCAGQIPAGHAYCAGCDDVYGLSVLDECEFQPMRPTPFRMRVPVVGDPREVVGEPEIVCGGQGRTPGQVCATGDAVAFWVVVGLIVLGVAVAWGVVT